MKTSKQNSTGQKRHTIWLFHFVLFAATLSLSPMAAQAADKTPGKGPSQKLAADLSSFPLNEDGTISVLLNGEIYNFQELRHLLVAKGHKFSTQSDTEAIVHLYEEFGERCFERLNGMFAIALWDRDRKSTRLNSSHRT